jgi:hypothetical protein
MSNPSLKSVFLIKEASQQHWTSNGVRYSVGALYDYAKEKVDPIPIGIEVLRKGFEGTKTDEPKWSPAFMQRADKAGDAPILVVTDEEGEFWIADGNHRYARALSRGEQEITGYVVAEWELPPEAIDPKK